MQKNQILQVKVFYRKTLATSEHKLKGTLLFQYAYDDITTFFMNMENHINIKENKMQIQPQATVKMSLDNGNLRKQFCGAHLSDKNPISGGSLTLEINF